MKTFFQILGQAVVIFVFAGLLAVMFIEWMAGCGESYIDSKGITHANECIIINHGK